MSVSNSTYIYIYRQSRFTFIPHVTPSASNWQTCVTSVSASANTRGVSFFFPSRTEQRLNVRYIYLIPYQYESGWLAGWPGTMPSDLHTHTVGCQCANVQAQASRHGAAAFFSSVSACISLGNNPCSPATLFFLFSPPVACCISA